MATALLALGLAPGGGTTLTQLGYGMYDPWMHVEKMLGARLHGMKWPLDVPAQRPRPGPAEAAPLPEPTNLALVGLPDVV